MKHIYLVKKTNALKTTYKAYFEYTTAMKEFRKHCKKMNNDQDNYDINYSICMENGVVLPDNIKPQAWFSVGCDDNRELVEIFCLETMYGGDIVKKAFILKVKTSLPKELANQYFTHFSGKSSPYEDNQLVREEYLVFNNRDIAIKRLDVYVDGYEKAILLPNQFSMNDIVTEDLLIGDNSVEFLIIDVDTSIESDGKDENCPPIITKEVKDAIFEDKLTRFHYESVKRFLINAYTDGLYDNWMDFVIEHEAGEEEKVNERCKNDFGINFNTFINSQIPFIAAKLTLERWTDTIKVDWSDIFNISKKQRISGDSEVLLQTYDESEEPEGTK